MPDDKKEPQSYGSQADWVSGNTGQTVNRLKGPPNSQHADFYESRRDSEDSAPEQGGLVSPEQASDQGDPSPNATASGESLPVQKVTAAEGGARRDSYFRERDYK